MFFHDIYFYDVVPIDFVLQPSFQHVEDSRLQALFQVLPPVLLKSKTVNTTKKYQRGFNTWGKFKNLFLVALLTRFFIYGLKSFHDLAGQPDPCNSPVAIQLLESAKRILSVPVKKKEPVTPEVIQRLVAYYGSASASLADLRLLALCVLGYAGFFRFNELVPIAQV